MRLYRIVGSAWAGTQAEAKKLSAEYNAPWHEAEIPTDKPGLLAFLNSTGARWRAEPPAPAVERTPAGQFDPMAGDPIPSREQQLDEGYSLDGTRAGSHPSLTFDDAWDGFPLARKLHFAALAMEDARGIIGAESAPKKAPQGFRGRVEEPVE